MLSFARTLKLCSLIVLAGSTGYLAFAMLSRGPILAHTPGYWDCACGDWVAKTTRLVIWNPLRDREPELMAYTFLANLRSGNCSVELKWCPDALSRHRVSDWQLAYREDASDSISLFFKLTKYDGGPAYDLKGAGVVGLRKGTAGWVVTNYDAMF